MTKEYTSLGLMSGTSGDGVDASIIRSDGHMHYDSVVDKYFEYDKNIYENIHSLKKKINSLKDLKKFSKKITSLEKKITLFHSEVVKDISKGTKIDLVGFHGQTMYHNPTEKISKQLGDGNLLSKLTKKTVVYNFRENDIKHGGQGAPLTPIFHNLLAIQIKKKLKDKSWPINIINIGGISNYTSTNTNTREHFVSSIFAYDIGPGNCLIDEWIRKKSNKRFDKDGLIARSGKPNKLIIKYCIKNFNNQEFEKSLKRDKSNLVYKRSFDTKDFDMSEVENLSLKDGAATLTDFTAAIILQGLRAKEIGHPNLTKWLVCGGGRKNKYLMESITKKGPDYLKGDNYIVNVNEQLDHWKQISLEPIDNYGIDGDFVESQAFAYLAIRSFLKMPISSCYTTGCKSKDKDGFTGGLSGGVIVKTK